VKVNLRLWHIGLLIVVVIAIAVPPTLMFVLEPPVPVESPVPELLSQGSLIEYTADWVPEETRGSYTKLLITATVMNIGAEGQVEVRSKIIEGDVEGNNSGSISFNLRRREEKTVYFEYWVNGHYQDVLWCCPPGCFWY
jgi:hypothetical protein